MAKKKLSTQEILAAARAEAAKKAGKAGKEAPESSEDSAQQETGESQEPVPSAEEPPGADTGENEAKPASGKPSPTPKSTKDILAAARAQAAGKKGGEQKSSAPSESAKPAASGGEGKPKSTKDILAAARAQAGKGASSAAPTEAKESPKSKTAGPSEPAGTKPAGERPSVQEMLKAAREGKKPESAVAEKTKPAKPPLPRKPLPKKAGKPSTEARRSVLLSLVATPFALAWTAFAATSAVFTLAMARFMMPNVLVEPPSKFKIGPPSDYPPGTVATKWKAQFGVWIVHTAYKGRDMIYALRTVCTHLGCTPNWLEGEQKFKCPCHGSGFYITGINFEGPAPRPLERVAITQTPDGMLEVDKSATFQEELDQWEDPASYYPVV